MAINPLQAPINYMGMIPQVDIGQGLAELGQILAQRKKEAQAQEQAIVAKQQFATDLQSARNNGSQTAWLDMIAKYPQFREAFGDVRKGYGEERVKNDFNEGFEVSLALENGRPDVAKQRLSTIIEARKNSGAPAGIYQQVFDALEGGNVQGAKSGVNMALSILDPDRYEKTVKAQSAATKAPEDLKEAIAKAESEGVKAEFARPMAIANLAKAKKELLAPSVQEAVDFGNLTPEQQRTFQNLQILKKPVTNVNVSNIDKTAAGELGKLVPDLYNQANSAATQLDDLPRYRTALKNAITGPLAEQRLTGARIAGALGFTGEAGVNATREVIQGLSEMALKSRSMLTGQGQITENEQRLLIKARSGDITFTKGELNKIFDVADRAAKAQYNQSKKLLKSASTQSPTAGMFLENLQPLPSETTPAPAAPGGARKPIVVDF